MRKHPRITDETAQYGPELEQILVQEMLEDRCADATRGCAAQKEQDINSTKTPRAAEAAAQGRSRLHGDEIHLQVLKAPA